MRRKGLTSASVAGTLRIAFLGSVFQTGPCWAGSPQRSSESLGQAVLADQTVYANSGIAVNACFCSAGLES